jgi:hypothetical protein
VIDPPEDLDVLSATLGVIFVFPAVALPDEVTLTWDLFSPRIQRVPAAATDEAGPLPSILEPDDPVLRWQNFLKHPTLPTLAAVGPPPGPWLRALAGAWRWLALLLVAAALTQAVASLRGRPRSGRIWAVCGALAIALAAATAAQRSAGVDDDEASDILASLLHNVYRAFDFRDESTIYDVLERSASGDLLEAIYLETRQGLELASQGGARAKVKEIELISVRSEDLDGRAGFRAHCTWNVRGSVGHWGHIHQRTNQYEAELTVAPVDGHLKIKSLELLQEERL